MNNPTRAMRSRARIRCMDCCDPIVVDVRDHAPPVCEACSITVTVVPIDPMRFTPESVKARVVMPPVDDDRVLSRVGGPIDAAVPSKGTRANTNRPKGTSQVVYDARLGYRRPSIG